MSRGRAGVSQPAQRIALALVLGSTTVVVAPLASVSSWPVLVSVSPGVWSMLSMLAGALVIIALSLSMRAGQKTGQSGSEELPMTFSPDLVIALVAGGLLALALIAQQGLRHWPASLANSDWVAEGQVRGLPVRADHYLRFDLQLLSIHSPEGQAAPARLPQVVRVTSNDVSLRVRSGQNLRITLRMRPPDGRMNPGGFDTRAWLLGDRVQALATHRTREPHALIDEQGYPSVMAQIGRWRDARHAALKGLPSLDASSAAVVSALAIGVADGIPADLKDTLRATGTAHLLAISGLHVSLMFAGVLMLLRACARPLLWLRLRGATVDAPYRHTTRHPVALDSDQLCVLMALAVAALYAVFAGFELPVQRALLMLVVGTVVLLRQRHSTPGNALALAVIGVLLLDPVAPLGAGFWLSVGAVAVILWLQVGRRHRHPVRRVVSIQCAIALVMLVPGAWWFGEVSLISPLANLIAVPWTTLVIVPGALTLTLLAEGAPVLADLFATVLQLAITLLVRLLSTLEQVPWAHQPASLPGGVALIAAISAAVLVSFPRRQAWIGFVPLLVLPAFLHAWRGVEVEGVELHVLDVGHGLAALVLTEASTVLIDTGGGGRQWGNEAGSAQRSGSTRLETVVLPYLLDLGRRRIDHLVLSHADHDHAGGLEPLLRQQPGIPIHTSDLDHVGAVMSESGLAQAPGQVTLCRAGEGFSLGGLSFDFLHPDTHDRGDRNNRSCVLLVHGQGVRLLLPGDIEAEAEHRLVARAGRLPVDVLIAPHHGSHSSSTGEFVDAFPADEVVFPAARYSKWGFPHTTVQMRYKLSGARLHHTGGSGALVFRFAGGRGDAGVVFHSREHQRLWRAPHVGDTSTISPVVSATDEDP